MTKKILVSLSIIGAVAAIIIGGTVAYFSDTETSTGNTFSAGTLDLKVDGKDDPEVVHVTLSDMKPGDSVCYKWELKNAGSLPGKVKISFSPVVNEENGILEPETYAELQPYATTTGELGQYVKRSCGYAPCSYSCSGMNDVCSSWQTGPQHPWGVPGLNGLGGNTYNFPDLNPNQSYCFMLGLTLENDLRRWDGTQWLDVDDNIIQSDSAQLDIIFKLEQVTP